MIQQVIPVGKKLLIKQKKAETFFKNTNIIIIHLAGYHKQNKVNIQNCIDSFANNNSDHNTISLLIILIILLTIFRFF